MHVDVFLNIERLDCIHSRASIMLTASKGEHRLRRTVWARIYTRADSEFIESAANSYLMFFHAACVAYNSSH